jgi:hypothetical protein
MCGHAGSVMLSVYDLVLPEMVADQKKFNDVVNS